MKETYTYAKRPIKETDTYEKNIRSKKLNNKRRPTHMKKRQAATRPPIIPTGGRDRNQNNYDCLNFKQGSVPKNPINCM